MATRRRDAAERQAARGTAKRTGERTGEGTGERSAALLHQARTVCRRAERWMVHLNEEESVNDQALIYVNRLSDYFFLLSRTANKAASTQETEWLPNA